MFRIECFCEDKALARVMHALAGQVADLRVVPAANVKKVNGKLEAKTNGNLIELLTAWLKKRKAEEITVGDARQFGSEHGYGPEYVLAKAKKAGIIRKIGKGTKTGYKVVLP